MFKVPAFYSGRFPWPRRNNDHCSTTVDKAAVSKSEWFSLSCEEVLWKNATSTVRTTYMNLPTVEIESWDTLHTQRELIMYSSSSMCCFPRPDVALWTRMTLLESYHNYRCGRDRDGKQNNWWCHFFSQVKWDTFTQAWREERTFDAREVGISVKSFHLRSIFAVKFERAHFQITTYL